MSDPGVRPLLMIWGFMTAGKTVVGKRVAELADAPFVDLDDAIEPSLGMSIAEFFDARGENAFREREGVMLRQLWDTTPRGVIALGGGSLLEASLRAEAMQRGFVVTLDVDIPRLPDRLDGARRPLLQTPHGLADAKALYEERLEAYRSTHCNIDTSNQAITAIAERILERWTGSQT